MTAAEACLKFVEELPASLAQYLVQQLRSGVTPSHQILYIKVGSKIFFGNGATFDMNYPQC